MQNYRNPYNTQQATSPSPVVSPPFAGSASSTAASNAVPGSNSLAPQSPSLTQTAPGAARPSSPSAGLQTGSTSDDMTYDPSNPIRALRAALSAKGIFADSSNPVIRYLMSMAQGLSTSFQLKGATGGLGATSPDEIAQRGGMNEMFKNYLMGGLQNGTGGLRGLIGTNSGGLMTDAANQMHAYNTQQAGGGPVNNGWMSGLKDQLGQNGNPSAMIASMYTPFMNGNYGRAFANTLGTQEDIATPIVSGQDTNTHDIFSYLLGMR